MSFSVSGCPCPVSDTAIFLLCPAGVCSEAGGPGDPPRLLRGALLSSQSRPYLLAVQLLSHVHRGFLRLLERPLLCTVLTTESRLGGHCPFT